MWVWSLVMERRSHVLCGQKSSPTPPKKRERRSNIVTNSIKNLKMVHIKKSLKIGILQQYLHRMLTLVFSVHLLLGDGYVCIFCSVSFFPSYWPWLLGFAIFLFLCSSWFCAICVRLFPNPIFHVIASSNCFFFDWPILLPASALD